MKYYYFKDCVNGEEFLFTSYEDAVKFATIIEYVCCETMVEGEDYVIHEVEIATLEQAKKEFLQEYYEEINRDIKLRFGF